MDFLSLGSLAKISPLFYPYRSVKIKMTTPTTHEYFKRKREEAEKKEMEETKKAKEVANEILDEVLEDEE